MAVRYWKPEKAVPFLLDKLSTLEDNVRGKLEDMDMDSRRSTVSKFGEIGSKLKIMSESMSRIKKWENKVVEKFCELEQALDDADYESVDIVKEKLEVIVKDAGELEKCIFKVVSVIGANGESEPEKQQEAADEVAPCETVSEEWAGLGVEDEMVKTEASLLESIHCPECPHLRMCLLCLSVFPENRFIKKRPLIYWWMGEGLVSSEEEGKGVLKELLKQRFIKQDRGGFSLCPWVRRVLIPLAQKHGFFKFSPLREGGRPLNGLRRAFLCERGMGNKPTDDHAPVLTVFNINEKYLVSTELEWLRGLLGLEVLQMGLWQDLSTHHVEVVGNYQQLLDAALSSKKHLRYLSLRGISGIETLPNAAIRKLVSLRILDVRACQNLERLPHAISELRNLTHLDVSKCYLLETMPKGLRHLLNLQVLKGFVVGTGSCKIADLAGLKHLTKLSIMVRRHGGQQLWSLKDLSALRILTIFWMGDAASNTNAAAVQLPTSLIRLDLRSVPFEELLQWLQPGSLPKLEKLCIKGGQLAKLQVNDNNVYQSVKSMRLQCLAHLRVKEDELVALFPNYVYLEKTKCHKDHPDITLKRESSVISQPGNH